MFFSCLLSHPSRVGGGGGGSSHGWPILEALPERVTFFRLQVYERVGDFTC